MKENRRAVLRADVRPLPVHLRRVMRLPERIEQLFITQLRRIERNLHHFRVSRFARANILVRRLGHLSTTVAHRGIDHPRNALKCRLHSPETPRSKCCRLCHGILHIRQSRLFFRTPVRCAMRLPRFRQESRVSFVVPWPLPQRSLTYPAPAPYRDYSRKPPARTHPSPRHFFSDSAARIPDGIDFERNFRHPASAAALPPLNSSPPARCLSFRCLPGPAN